MWVRDSPLVSIDSVKVTGLSGGPDSPAIRRALASAARDMTTLHVRPDRLRTAVAPYPIVKDIQVVTDFPHGLRIKVIEHDAVAAVQIDGQRVPVAADGTVLRGRPAANELVTLSIPTANGGGKLTSAHGRDAVRAMGAAPRALRPYVSDVQFGPDGLRVLLRNGPLVQFGDANRARAKWIAIARVLGDPRAAGASYLDVRVPERPVAGRFDEAGSAAPVLDGATPHSAAATGHTGDATTAQTATTPTGQTDARTTPQDATQTTSAASADNPQSQVQTP
jgi:cell division protein FtsQ